MVTGVLVVVLTMITAFFTLDLFFRFMDLTDPRQSLHRAAILYATLAVIESGLGLWLAWSIGGAAGLLVAITGVPIWWVLWRFGLRKQFPHLFPRLPGQVR